jgi:undecaprenyl-diphosphatase
MFIVQAVVLGIVQGLTEFLPVSSSGHLILVPTLFGWTDQGLSYDTVLHLGTLLAVLWFFRQSLIQLVKELFSKQPAQVEAARTLLIQLVVCSLPALVLGFILNDWIENVSRKPWLVVIDLAFWGLVLWRADYVSKDRVAGAEESPTALPRILWSQALMIAIAQPIALLPGSSRSGITMTAGLFMGLSRSAAARFSFLLSIPVTAAAGGYGLLKWITQGADTTTPSSMLVIGFIAALLSGVFAIRFLLSYVSHRRFTPFIVYRLVLAVAVLVLLVR